MTEVVKQKAFLGTYRGNLEKELRKTYKRDFESFYNGVYRPESKEGVRCTIKCSYFSSVIGYDNYSLVSIRQITTPNFLFVPDRDDGYNNGNCIITLTGHPISFSQVVRGLDDLFLRESVLIPIPNGKWKHSDDIMRYEMILFLTRTKNELVKEVRLATSFSERSKVHLG